MTTVDEPGTQSSETEERDRALRASLLGLGLGLALSFVARLGRRRARTARDRSHPREG